MPLPPFNIDISTGVIEPTLPKPPGYLPGYLYLVDDTTPNITVEKSGGSSGLLTRVYLCVSDTDSSLLDTVISETRTGNNDILLFHTDDPDGTQKSILRSNFTNAVVGTEIVLRFNIAYLPPEDDLYNFFTGDNSRNKIYHKGYTYQPELYDYYEPGLARILIDPTNARFTYEDWADGDYNDLIGSAFLEGALVSPIPSSPPTAIFLGSPRSGSAPLSVSFIDASTENITSWLWDFGDGNNSTDQNPTHTYSSVGTYTVSLTVTGPDGSDIETKVSYISVTNPNLDFTYTPVEGSAPLTVDFQSTSLGDIIQYDWDFGDGSDHGTSQDVSHTYTVSGIFTVTLTVTYSDLSKRSTSKYPIIAYYTPSYKTSTVFTSLGWIKDIVVGDNKSIIPLAVSDLYGNVIGSEDSIKIEVLREGLDYRLKFCNSISKLIDKTLNIKLNDKKWHMIAFISLNEEGDILYYVDGRALSTETGSNSEGLSYSKAYSTSVRKGGGDVWCPYLNEKGTSFSVFNWRLGVGFALDSLTIFNLFNKDRYLLNIYKD